VNGKKEKVAKDVLVEKRRKIGQEWRRKASRF